MIVLMSLTKCRHPRSLMIIDPLEEWPGLMLRNLASPGHRARHPGIHLLEAQSEASIGVT